MGYNYFRDFAIKQDIRNEFGKASALSTVIPQQLHPFYASCNPTDVEILFDGVAVRFIAAECIADIQQDYDIAAGTFVFATCNGDPIFLYDNAVYTCPHGAGKAEWESLSESFDAYIKLLSAE